MSYMYLYLVPAVQGMPEQVFLGEKGGGINMFVAFSTLVRPLNVTSKVGQHSISKGMTYDKRRF